jgi:hypothetical protein
VILGSTAAEGSTVVERDVQKMIATKLGAKAATVARGDGVGRASAIKRLDSRRSGIALAQQTGGRLRGHCGGQPGSDAAARNWRAGGEEPSAPKPAVSYTYERPRGATGKVGEVGMSAARGFTPSL